jgi:hypothetical protein
VNRCSSCLLGKNYKSLWVKAWEKVVKGPGTTELDYMHTTL